jgi:alpha-L-rhamnosidase
VSEGGRAAREAAGLRFLRMEDGAAVFAAEPGDYHFKVTSTTPR